MEPHHPARQHPEALLADCDIRFLRRSGPGGQNRNKVETAVVLTHRPTGLVAEANERRSQGENREAALFRLRLLLALKIRSPHGPSDPPGPLWTSRCRGGRIAINPHHDDFPALLAEAIDFLEARAWGVGEAAGALGVSASQLAKFLKLEPRAFMTLNERRKALGLHPLR